MVTEDPGRPSAGIDTTVPHSARVWNYWLGGKDNYAVDREAGAPRRSAASSTSTTTPWVLAHARALLVNTTPERPPSTPTSTSRIRSLRTPGTS
jgi:S-adenosyl methyltransferase